MASPILASVVYCARTPFLAHRYATAAARTLLVLSAWIAAPAVVGVLIAIVLIATGRHETLAAIQAFNNA